LLDSTNKKVALIIAPLASFLTPFMSSSINIALPSIGEEFSAGAVLLGWVATSYLLSSVMFLIPLGKSADIYGRKKVFAYGTVLYTASSLLCVFSTTIVYLLIFRILQGIGGAMIYGTCIAILTSVFPPQDRGRVLGITAAATYLGLSAGPILGGVLTQYFGWRSIFLINIPFGLLVIYLVFTKLKGEWAEAEGEKLDLAGSLIFSAAIIALMYGLSLIPSRQGIRLSLAGTAGIVFFILWEKRSAHPILNIDLFTKNRVFAFSNLAALINYSATYAIGFILSLYLQYIKGFDPKSAGLLLIAQPIIMSFFSPLSGRLSDKIDPKILASAGMGLISVGLVPLVYLNAETSPLFIICSLMVLGLGFAFFSSPNTNAIMSSVENIFYGIASATLATMRLVGQLLSMGLVMLILNINIGNEQVTPAYHGPFLLSLKIVFVIFIILCFCGVFASLARGKSNKKGLAG
jgi:EmrB/QacA subfamily drug resistance transporter